MQGYLKMVAGDYALTALLSMAASYLVLDGFYVDPSLQYGPVPAFAALACCAALFAASRDMRSARIVGAGYAVALIVAWVVCAAMTPGDFLADTESNHLIFSMVVTLAPTVCFLATRRRVGTALFLAAAVIVIAVLQLFYGRYELVWALLLVFACLALLVLKNYQVSLNTATTVRRASMAPGVLVAGGLAAIAVGIGALVWFGIVAQLGPQAVEIKLITEYRALETRQVIGTSSEFQMPNTDMTSDVTNDGSRTTDDIKESLDGTPWPATGEEEDDPNDESMQSSFTGIDLDSLQQTFDMQQNPAVLPVLLFILLAILVLCLAYFLGRRAWRTRRLARLRALGADGEYKGLFLWLLGRLERVGVSVPEGQTLMEFSKSASPALAPFNRESGQDFSQIAADYCSIAYGNGQADFLRLERLEAFYISFWKACREEMGNLKYFWKSFRL